MFQTTNQLHGCASQALVPSCSQQDNCHFELLVYQYESYIIYPHYKFIISYYIPTILSS